MVDYRSYGQIRAEAPRAPTPSYAESLPDSALATPSWRLASFLIDCCFLVPPMLIVASVLGAPPGSKPSAEGSVGMFALSAPAAHLLSRVLRLVVYDLYFGPLAVALGASPGKWLLGLRAIDENGKPISHGRARGHYWACALAVLPLGAGLIAMLFDKQRRGWHDKLAGVWFVKPEFVRMPDPPPVERDPSAIPPGMGGGV